MKVQHTALVLALAAYFRFSTASLNAGSQYSTVEGSGSADSSVPVPSASEPSGLSFTACLRPLEGLEDSVVTTRALRRPPKFSLVMRRTGSVISCLLSLSCLAISASDGSFLGWFSCASRVEGRLNRNMTMILTMAGPDSNSLHEEEIVFMITVLRPP